ncbi:MAG: hypothetical protein KGR23_08085 [Betaproteobacteria bacterium]|nr:hypothetical protein [Betaproteobacteria bacterium]
MRRIARTSIALAWVTAGTFLGAASSLAGSVDQARALQVVQRHSAALVSRDPEAMVSTEHPALILRYGGEAAYRRQLQILFDAYREQGLASEELGTPSTEYIDGPTRMIGVPAIRKLRDASVGIVYVVVSYDSGNTWTVFDLACTDTRWLKALAPGYAGVPNILGPALDPDFQGAGPIDSDRLLNYFSAGATPRPATGLP